MELVTLSNLAGGALAERFADALQQVLENIQDPNTDAEKKRTITMQLVIAPDGDREVGSVVINVQTKLAPLKHLSTFFHMGVKNGDVVVYEQNPKQPGLFDSDQPKPRPNLMEIKKYDDQR